jgi:hypothetical protein
MDTLFEFCAALDRLRVRYGLQIVRDEAVMVTVLVPGQYLEIERFAGGSVEIERFVSLGSRLPPIVIWMRCSPP